uniref:Secreted protein n=1 Tax=Arundo donax TaxID=35708 RepID=A0A0A9FAU6_ARUDO
MRSRFCAWPWWSRSLSCLGAQRCCLRSATGCWLSMRMACRCSGRSWRLDPCRRWQCHPTGNFLQHLHMMGACS